jgi:hypothetical protein
MRPNILVYLAGPLTATPTHTVAENIASAAAVYFDCIRRGIPAFCPHLGATFDEAFSIGYEAWMAYDFSVIDRCTHVLMLPRWETSAGAKREKDYAFLRGIQTFYLLDELEAYLCEK